MNTNKTFYDKGTVGNHFFVRCSHEDHLNFFKVTPSNGISISFIQLYLPMHLHPELLVALKRRICYTKLFPPRCTLSTDMPVTSLVVIETRAINLLCAFSVQLSKQMRNKILASVFVLIHRR